MKNNLSRFNSTLGHLAFLLSIIPFCVCVLAVYFMPESVPMHYNSAGEVNRFGSSMEMVLVGFLFSATAVIMPIAFDRIKMVEYGKLIGFILAIIMEITFIVLTAYFVSKIFEISDVIKCANGGEKTAFFCSAIGAVLLVFGSIVNLIFKNISAKSNREKVALPIIFSMCGGVEMVLSLLVRNYLSLLILAIGLAVCIISTFLTASKKELV